MLKGLVVSEQNKRRMSISKPLTVKTVLVQWVHQLIWRGRLNKMQEREILFRGKRKDNGEWIYGDLIQVPTKNSYSIIEHTPCAGVVEVTPETVGQYTGLTDKNGVKIFEGDILLTNKFNNLSVKYIVTYDLSFAGFIGLDKNEMYFATFDGDGECFEVIGNIHDNPELLEVK